MNIVPKLDLSNLNKKPIPSPRAYITSLQPTDLLFTYTVHQKAVNLISSISNGNLTGSWM
jgi:hypothetical protein